MTTITTTETVERGCGCPGSATQTIEHGWTSPDRPASQSASHVSTPTLARCMPPVEERDYQYAAAAWQRHVQATPGATLFHEPIWSQVVQRVFGHRGRHQLAWRGDRVVGVLPLIEVRSLFGGTMLVSVPYGTYGGILADDAQARDVLVAAAEQTADECGARVIDLRSAEPQVAAWTPVDRYDAFVRDLPLHPNELERFLPRHARAAVRQAREREGIEILHDQGEAAVHGSPAKLPIVWELYARSMRRLGSLNYPYRFFAELVAGLGDRAWVTLAFQAGRPVGGVVSFVFRDTVMPYVIGLDERIRSYGASNLLYYSIMERAVRAGLRQFDFGRSRKDNQGSAQFKKNQGFHPRTLGYQRFVPAGRAAPELTPSNRRFDLARRVWQRLPLAVTRRVGGWLARSFPG